jgi:DNA-binding LacI/PurR family transcriptional regulator/DNA-binding transcriptional regulator YhcF (GntR family)
MHAYQDLSTRLEELIRKDPSAGLPTINELAGKFNVSYATMWRAVQELVRAGTLVASRGRHISIAPGAHPQVKGGWNSSSDRLYEKLRQGVLSGQFHAGKPFPKLGYFALTEKVSGLTTARAFARLGDEDLAHRVNRRWVAGPRTKKSAAARPAASAPVVLIQVGELDHWTIMMQSPSYSKFTSAFLAEATNHGVQFQPVLRFRADDDYLSVPALSEGTRSLIQGLEERYLGTLMVTGYPREERIHSWVPMLSSFKRPVVFFDHTDKAPNLTRQELKCGPGYFRMHIDERAGALLVMRHLSDAGHRRIGIHGAEAGEWARQRIALLREIGESMDPRIEVVEAGPAETEWGFETEKDMHHFTRAMAVKAGITGAVDDEAARPESLAAYRRLLREQAGSLVRLLVDRKPTGLICLNDRMAREYYFWCVAVGIKVPRDLSLISFDNTFDSALIPVSTIDFGFQRLGYQAAHIFIGDLPVRGDRAGAIPGPCVLIDRGSVGRPGDAKEIESALRM